VKVLYLKFNMSDCNCKSGTNSVYVSINFGCVLASVISWSIHKSISWAIIHGIFGWFYVIYYAIVRD